MREMITNDYEVLNYACDTCQVLQANDFIDVIVPLKLLAGEGHISKVAKSTFGDVKESQSGGVIVEPELVDPKPVDSKPVDPVDPVPTPPKNDDNNPSDNGKQIPVVVIPSSNPNPGKTPSGDVGISATARPNPSDPKFTYPDLGDDSEKPLPNSDPGNKVDPVEPEVQSCFSVSKQVWNGIVILNILLFLSTIIFSVIVYLGKSSKYINL